MKTNLKTLEVAQIMGKIKTGTPAQISFASSLLVKFITNEKRAKQAGEPDQIEGVMFCDSVDCVLTEKGKIQKRLYDLAGLFLMTQTSSKFIIDTFAKGKLEERIFNLINFWCKDSIAAYGEFSYESLAKALDFYFIQQTNSKKSTIISKFITLC